MIRPFNKSSQSVAVPVEVPNLQWNRKKRRAEAAKMRRGLTRPPFVQTNGCPCTSAVCEVCNARGLSTMTEALEKYWSKK